jgi:TPR repeat protein
VRAATSGPVRTPSGEESLAASQAAEEKKEYEVAFKKLSAAALTGHRRASYQRALTLLYGLNLVNVNQPGARSLLKRLHDSKLPVAEGDELIVAATSCLYAEVLFHGLGGPVDRATARLAEAFIAWNGCYTPVIPKDRSGAVTSAAATAIAAADKIDSNDIHILLWRAIGQKDGFIAGGGISGALPILRTLADTRGHTYAAILAAELLAVTDAPLARSLVARAAARASPLALFVMACMQRKGFGGDVDVAASDALLLRAKAAGHSGAHELLAGRPVVVYA